MRNTLITLTLILSTLTMYSQNKHGVYISNWQAIESASGVTAGVAVYGFKIDKAANTITFTNKKGTKNWGTMEIGKVYEDGKDTWYYEMGTIGIENLIHKNKQFIRYNYKNTFTGKYQIVTYILAQSK